jgi:N-acetyl-anhydromuramyl-L-alanine amidase AmpD
MLHIDDLGHVLNRRVTRSIMQSIERGPMTHVRGIIVHQTGGPTAQATLNSYAAGGAGAHFLIDKDGAIYQTASVLKVTWHVGKLRARCLAENRCAPTEIQKLLGMSPTPRNRHEMKKQVPNRYPSNEDSIGIEVVGQAFPLNEPNADKRTYESVTEQENISLKWLVEELTMTLGVPMTEIFRHPVVSQKNVTEAGTAKW